MQFTPGELDRDATFYVAGHRGLVGSAIVRRLQAAGFDNIIGKTSAELDLKDRDAVFDFFAEAKPRYVVLAAAKVGGILANNTYPVDFLSDNIRIQVNVLDAALRSRAWSDCCSSGPRASTRSSPSSRSARSRCSPATSSRPTTRTRSRRSPASCTSRRYADSTGCRGSRRCRRTSTDPNDNFSPTGSHVLPALIRRYDEAVDVGRAVGDQLGHRHTAARVPARR